MKFCFECKEECARSPSGLLQPVPGLYGHWEGRWSRAVAIRPTGWTYTLPTGTDLSPSIPQPRHTAFPSALYLPTSAPRAKFHC